MGVACQLRPALRASTRRSSNNPLSVGSGEFLLWEFPLCLLAGAARLRRDLLLQQRHARRPSAADACKAFLSVGHDEYWDLRQYEQRREAAVDAGVNLLFLSGNAVCWCHAVHAGSDGRPNRDHHPRRPLRRHAPSAEKSDVCPILVRSRARPGRGLPDRGPDRRAVQRRRRLDRAPSRTTGSSPAPA